MEINRLNYDKASILDAEPRLGHVFKRTITVKDSDVLHCLIPPDPECFSDLNSILLTIPVKIVAEDGSDIGADEKVFLDFNGQPSLFSTCCVRFDGQVVSNMTNYWLSAALCRWFGSTQENRDMWSHLDGSKDIKLGKSGLTADATLDAVVKTSYDRYAGSATVTLICRIYSDILLSCRQYLPPGVELSIELRRAPASISVCSLTPNKRYKIEMDNANFYMDRLYINSAILAKPLSSIKQSATMLFNRLETKVQTMSKGTTIWKWLDVLNGATLPNRMYIGFVTQTSYYGSFSKFSTFFEHMNLSEYNVKLNGRDILTEPLKTKYLSKTTKDIDLKNSNAIMPYLTLMDIFGHVKNNLSPCRLSYEQYMQGKSVIVTELGKCGEKSGVHGVLDLEVSFLFTILKM